MSTGRPYSKPWLTLEDQAALLQSRGLDDAVRHVDDLRRVGYYRLSGYWYPLRSFASSSGRRADHFVPGVTFSDVMALYRFDDRLKTAVWTAMCTLEVEIRVQLGYELGRVDAFIHERPDLLDSTVRSADYEKFAGTVRELVGRSHEDFVAHFRRQYDGRLPIWVLTEVLQFGQLATLYRFAAYEQRVAIASTVGARADEYYSWLKALNIVRNVTAHHGRLWNRPITIKPQLRSRRRDPLLAHALESVDRPYGTLAVIAYLLRKSGQHDAVTSLRDALASFPAITGLQIEMTGAPTTWADQRLWN